MTTNTAPLIGHEIHGDKLYTPPDVQLEVLPIESLGEGLKILKTATMELDHSFATRILDLPPFIADRTLSNEHVAMLVKTMERGTFHPEWVTIITCVLNGKEYRANGQHTAWARLEMPEKWRCPIRWIKYQAETEEDFRRLYASIDRGFARTIGAVTVSYLYGTPEFAGFSKGTVRRLSEACAFWNWENKTERYWRDGDDRVYVLKTDHLSVARQVGSFIENCRARDHRHLLRRAVIAAMFATWNKAAAASVDFWTPVKDGIGFSGTNDPRLKLRNALLSSSVDAGNHGIKKGTTAEEMLRWCYQAWNLYRTQKPMDRSPMALLDKPRPAIK